MTIDTARVKDRRTLAFTCLTDVVADAERIHACDRDGTLRRTGNWTAAQSMNHVAAFMEFPFEGFPPELSSPPWFVRFIVKFFKKKYLAGLPVGVKIPGIPGGTVGATDGPADAALARLRRAAGRLQESAPTAPSPVFGPLTHDEWRRLNIRHAELHFSFLHPR